MPSSVTTWNRVEPQSRSDDMGESLQARIHDPLWLLARQWQFLEFRGEDAGSPVKARLQAEHAPLTRYHAGPMAGPVAAGEPYDPAKVPLEAMVERERVHDAPGGRWRLSVESGQHFARLLRAAGVGARAADYLARYPFKVDPAEAAEADADAQRYLSVVAERVIDGAALRIDMAATLDASGTGTLPATVAIPAADEPKVRQAAAAWLAWHDARWSEPAPGQPSAWNRERMEYAFSVAAPARDGETVLSADEYADGHMDWHSFDARPQARLGAASEKGRIQPVTRVVIPAPLDAPGLPASRFWEFEDAHVSLGDVKAGAVDLARLLFVEFAMIYGNDWFLIPVDMPVGSVCTTRSLVVTDTFGLRTLVKHTSEVDGAKGAWRMFHVTGAPAGTFLLPPALGGMLEGDAWEEVALLRDEMANMAWAIERTVQSPAGGGIDRSRDLLERAARAAPAAPAPARPPAAPLAYRLRTDVPENWIPLVPVAVNLRSIRLQRGRVLRSDGRAVPPVGQILDPGAPLALYEEEVPREGATVTRSPQHARWIGGTTHLWVGRRKAIGRGEGSSGLAFDNVREASTTR